MVQIMSGDGYLLLTQASEQPEKKLQKIISGPITKMLPAIKINNQDEKRPGQTQINGPGKAQITKPQTDSENYIYDDISMFYDRYL